MHSCNYVVFEKFTCANINTKLYWKLLPEQDSFKMLYVLQALQRFHIVDCGQ